MARIRSSVICSVLLFGYAGFLTIELTRISSSSETKSLRTQLVAQVFETKTLRRKLKESDTLVHTLTTKQERFKNEILRTKLKADRLGISLQQLRRVTKQAEVLFRVKSYKNDTEFRRLQPLVCLLGAPQSHAFDCVPSILM